MKKKKKIWGGECVFLPFHYLEHGVSLGLLKLRHDVGLRHVHYHLLGRQESPRRSVKLPDGA
jgi:hypothetical protein